MVKRKPKVALIESDSDESDVSADSDEVIDVYVLLP